MPRAGDYVVVIDGAGEPRCIWRTTQVEIKPLIEGDAQFAQDEGEGDRTLGWWLKAHLDYFTAQAAQEDFEMSDQIATVFERFEVIWPLESAD